MALNSGTPKTDWTTTPTSSELVNGFNRIEGNLQDLEDSKVERQADGVDLSESPDADVSLLMATGAQIDWDESDDQIELSLGAQTKIEVHDTPSETGPQSLGPGATWTPPAGFYQMYVTIASGTGESTGDLSIDIFVPTFWRPMGFNASSVKNISFMANGQDVRVHNNSAGITYNLYYLRF